jgi:hypothetical protein
MKSCKIGVCDSIVTAGCNGSSKQTITFKEMIGMNEPHKTVEVEHKDVQYKSDSSKVASTFIKYAAYIIIFFGFLYFLVKYVFPKF